MKEIAAVHATTHREFVDAINAGATPMPDGDVAYHFTPTEPFFSPDFNSGYEPGLFYTVHANNERLHACAVEWQKQGLVRILGSLAAAQGAMESSVAAQVAVE
jgi:hypothetical protein